MRRTLDRIFAQESCDERLSLKTYLLVFGFFVLLTLVMLWPLPTALGSSVAHDNGDSLLNVWILAWDVHALTTNPGELLNPNIYYPYKTVLAYSEYLFFPALLAMPVIALTGNPLLAHNLLLLFAFAASAFTMFLLAYYLLRNIPAAIIAGIIYSFYPYRLETVTQLQFVSAYWLPLGLLGLLHYLRDQGRVRLRWMALFFACIVLQALTSLYLTFFLAIAGLLPVIGIWFAKPWKRREVMLPLIIGGGITLLLLLPLGLPYLRVNRELGMSRTIQQVIFFSTDVKDYFSAPPTSLLYGSLTSVMRAGSRFSQANLFPGIVAPLLAILGWLAVMRQKPGRVWVYAGLLVVLGTILTLGPFLIAFGNPLPVPLPYLLLYFLVPGFQSLRLPTRFVSLSTLGLGLLAGVGVVWLAARLRVPAFATYLVAGLLIVLEFLSPQVLVPVPTGDAIPPVYRHLATLPADQPIVELPVEDWVTEARLKHTTSYMYFSTVHWHPLLNGYSGFAPPTYSADAALLQRFPSDAGIALLQQRGVQYVVLHKQYYSPDEWNEIQNALPHQHALELIRVFRSNEGEDWLLRVIYAG